jgi:hypothetical protein
MFGFRNQCFSDESKQLIENIMENFANTPMYSAYQVESFVNPNGVISLVVSKHGKMVNRFDFWSDGTEGNIGSIAIYGAELRGHANAIRSSAKIFGLPVSDVSYEYDLVDVTLDNYDVNNLRKTSIIDSLLSGSNHPNAGVYKFDSTDHIRYQDGEDVSGHNYGCHRQVEIKNNINGGEGYTITIYNLDGNHPLWGNNVQMAPKQMRIINHSDNVVSLRGFGYDVMGGNFSDYGVDLHFTDKDITKIVLKMFDRNVELEYYR